MRDTWHVLDRRARELVVLHEVSAPGMDGNIRVEHYFTHPELYIDIPRLIDADADAVEDAAWAAGLPGEIQRALRGERTAHFEPDAWPGASRRWSVMRSYALFPHRHRHRMGAFRGLAEGWLRAQAIPFTWRPPRFSDAVPPLALP